MPKLEVINLEENQLFRVPEALAHLKQLRVLNISKNPVDSGGFGPLARLTTLQVLIARGGSFSSVPEPVLCCVSLSTLDFSENSRISLEKAPLGKLPNLKVLRIANCSLHGSHLPLGVQVIATLEELDISGNSFNFESLEFFGTHIPLTLRVLHLEHSRLFTLPDALSRLRSLVHLNLARNPIHSLEVLAGILAKRLDPPSSPRLTNLSVSTMQDLVSESIAEALPSAGDSFHSECASHKDASKSGKTSAAPRSPSIVKLSLQNCGLTRLPEYFDSLVSLEELDLSENNELDGSLTKLFLLENLRSLNIVNCPLAEDISRYSSEWFRIRQLKKLSTLKWTTWRGANNISAYRTRIPIDICGLPLTSINDVPLREGLFVSDPTQTVVNLLRDSYFKLDIGMDESSVRSYFEAARLFEPYESFFFPNTADQKTLFFPTDEFTGEEADLQVSEVMNDLSCARLRITLMRYLFFLAAQAANYDASIIPPLDVMIVHYAHMCMWPQQYREDCETICRRVLQCRYSTFFENAREFSSAAHRSVLESKKVWNLMAKTSRSRLSWLSYDFWPKQWQTHDPSYEARKTEFGLLSLPTQSFTSTNAVKRENEQLNKMSIVGDLKAILDYSVESCIQFEELTERLTCIKQLFESNSFFLKHRASLDDRRGDWSQYLKYITLYSLHYHRDRNNTPFEHMPNFSMKQATKALASEASPLRLSSSLKAVGKHYDPEGEDYLNSVSSFSAGATSEAEGAHQHTFSIAEGSIECHTPLKALHASPVPPIWVMFLLMVHRASPMKYLRLLALFDLEMVEPAWEQTPLALEQTAAAWSATFNERFSMEKDRALLEHEKEDNAYENGELDGANSSAKHCTHVSSLSIDRLGNISASLSGLHISYSKEALPTKPCLLQGERKRLKKVSFRL